MTVVRTRFAPSPTGYMHLGGMRTALFAWLWARHNHGVFVLRIDDTDQQRNVESALEPIFRAFRWLGLDWDEGPQVGGNFGPYFQSQRSDIYQRFAKQLLDEGKAFRDFDSPEAVAEDRRQAEQAKKTYVNTRRSLDLTPSEIEQFLAEKRPYVIRFLVPRDQSVTIDDAVRETVTWDCSQITDPVIQRSNGAVLYNFATVVDDATMQMTHIVRAEEHLANTPVQALIHDAIGNPRPVFAHIPFITAPGTTRKLSKRDVDKLRNSPQLKKMFDRADEVFPQLGLGDSKTLNPVMIEFYEKLGYLPAGMLNALSRLGWSLDDRTEIMSLQMVVENFTLGRIVKSSAGYDPEKLNSFETYWMGQLPLEQKVAGCLAVLKQASWCSDWASQPGAAERLHEILPVVGERLRIFTDILDYREFFIADEQLSFDPKAFEQRIRKSEFAQELLAGVSRLLETTKDFSSPALDESIHRWMEEQGKGMGEIVHALRVAITGRSAGVGLFDALALIGKKSSLVRIDRALALCKSPDA